MAVLRTLAAAIAATMLLAPAGSVVPAMAAPAARTIAVTVQAASGAKLFHVELARTSAEQERGLMFRTNLPADGGMLFAPYPGDGGPPRVATFWMENTPTALDILFIRKDGTIARIAANAAPFSEERLGSGEAVAAVLEIHAGKAAELGIAEGDKVSWEKPGR